MLHFVHLFLRTNSEYNEDYCKTFLTRRITVCENWVKIPQRGQMLNCSANCNLVFVRGLVNTALMKQNFIRVHIIGD